MNRKKQFIKISRAIAIIAACLILLINSILYTLYYYNNTLANGTGLIYMPYMITFTILLFISILIILYLYEISYYEYEYNNLNIAIYSDGINHYLYINGLEADSFKGRNKRYIYLRCKYNSHRIEAIIPRLSTIKLIIDNQRIHTI